MAEQGHPQITPEFIVGMAPNSIKDIPSLEEVFASGLTGKVAVVTGGARGLGFTVANRLAEAGAKVVVADVFDGAGSLDALKAKGFDVAYINADVSKVDECYKMADFAVETYGRIDICVANAAIWNFYAFLDTPEEAWDKVLDTNLKGEYYTVQACARQMVRQGEGGKVVMIASVAHIAKDLPHMAMMTTYNASKGGVVSVARGISKELKQYGINVNCVAPGGMMTMGGMVNGPEASQLYGPEFNAERSKYGRDTPVATNPDAVALLVYGMCTRMSDFMYGEVIDCDGGVKHSFQDKPWSYTQEGGIPGPGAE